MTLFQFDQMFLIVHKFEWTYSGHISALMFCAFLLRNSQ